MVCAAFRGCMMVCAACYRRTMTHTACRNLSVVPSGCCCQAMTSVACCGRALTSAAVDGCRMACAKKHFYHHHHRCLHWNHYWSHLSLNHRNWTHYWTRRSILLLRLDFHYYRSRCNKCEPKNNLVPDSKSSMPLIIQSRNNQDSHNRKNDGHYLDAVRDFVD